MRSPFWSRYYRGRRRTAAMFNRSFYRRRTPFLKRSAKHMYQPGQRLEAMRWWAPGVHRALKAAINKGGDIMSNLLYNLKSKFGGYALEWAKDYATYLYNGIYTGAFGSAILGVGAYGTKKYIAYRNARYNARRQLGWHDHIA